MDYPYPWLKYVSADGVLDERDNIKNKREALKGVRVSSDAGENLGKVGGFVVDSESGRPYYVVVDAGRWFKAKQFLIPIGHTRIDTDQDGLVTDLSKERVKRFPGFDTDEFDRLTEADIKEMNNRICAEFGSADRAIASDEPFTAAWDRPDYQTPGWW